MAWRASLREQINSRCGDPEDQMASLGHKFGQWVEDGQDAPSTSVAEVERTIDGYLAKAEQVGRVWGIVVGLLVGLLGAAIAFVGIWAAS